MASMSEAPTIGTLKDQFLEAVGVLANERDRLQEALSDAASAWALVGEQIAHDVSPQVCTTLLDPGRLRGRVSEALDEWERARHRSLRLLFEMLVAEGLSMAEVGRTFGVSRSLVSRFIHEA
jgi:hypothetical protein